ERERAVGQCERRLNLPAKRAEHERDIAECTRIVGRGLYRTPGETDRRAAMRLRVFHSAKPVEMVVADGGQRERRAENWVALDCPLEEIECSAKALFVPGEAVGLSAQVEIIGSEISRRAAGQAADFGSLHG